MKYSGYVSHLTQPALPGHPLKFYRRRKRGGQGGLGPPTFCCATPAFIQTCANAVINSSLFALVHSDSECSPQFYVPIIIIFGLYFCFIIIIVTYCISIIQSCMPLRSLENVRELMNINIILNFSRFARAFYLTLAPPPNKLFRRP